MINYSEIIMNAEECEKIHNTAQALRTEHFTDDSLRQSLLEIEIAMLKHTLALKQLQFSLRNAEISDAENKLKELYKKVLLINK